MARFVQWFASLAALVLIGMSLGGYFYHRRQMEAIAARHLRLVVIGPGQLQPGAGASYTLLTTHVTGEPWSVPIEWSLSTSDGKLVDRKEPTDDQGRLAMNVPADMALRPRVGGTAQLGVNAGEGDNAINIALPLTVLPPRYHTHLEVDRRDYRPGDTVYYRSLTVDRHSASLCRRLPLEFEILDLKAAPLADSQWIGLTDHGVGNGSFRLPVSVSPGTYTLVARGADEAFAEQRLVFDVAGAAGSRTPAKSAAANKRGGKKTVHVEFFPEGGALAAGLENRIYFCARDEDGQPLDVRGTVVNGNGDNVATLKAAPDGRGRFSIVPSATESYRVKIVDPPGIADSPALPPVLSAQRIAITAEHSVLAPGAPLELSLRASKENVPLVVTASAGGLTTGEKAFVTPASGAEKGTAVTVPLSECAAGVIRVTVFDYSTSPPVVVAERFVFRQPRRLTVRVVPSIKASDNLLLSVQNEKGQPVAATVSLTLLSRANTTATAEIRPPADVLNALLANDLPDRAALAGLDLNATSAIELVLGCQNLHPQGATPSLKPRPGETAATIPVVYDNFNDLRNQYDYLLSEYRARRTQTVNALVMLSFFGGLALAALVTMLILLRILWGGLLWLPVLGTVICCALVTVVSIAFSHMQTEEIATVGFANFTQPAPAIATSPTATPAPDGPLHRLAEKLAKFGADAEELKADRFPVQQYTSLSTSNSATHESSDKPVAWYPLLTTGPDGRVAVPAISAAAAKGLRLLIEAHGDGRLESCELPLNP
jgi:hypothetical protein